MFMVLVSPMVLAKPAKAKPSITLHFFPSPCRFHTGILSFYPFLLGGITGARVRGATFCR
jgi:hypothetical protein